MKYEISAVLVISADTQEQANRVAVALDATTISNVEGCDVFIELPDAVPEEVDSVLD